MPKTAAELIRSARKALRLTQRELADQLYVSDKAVSKWERGAGLPDSALVPEIARILNLSAVALLGGSVTHNPPDGGNMKRIKFYQCPNCGNLLTSTGSAELTCCNRRLSPMKLTPADDAHRLSITDVEDEKLLTWQHPMEKAHHLTFIACVGDDCVHLVRLYPEGTQEHRMPRIPWAKYVCGCTEMPDVLFLSGAAKRG